MTTDLPGVQADEPAPLTVIPKAKDPKIEFLKDFVTGLSTVLIVYSLIYVIVYAISAGWHDAQ